jgi:alpha-L-fucosidase
MPRPAGRLAVAVLAPVLAAQDPVLVPPGADADAIAARSADVRPSQRQLAWQQLGFTAFVHFGMNTFHDREWGLGTEDPAAFAPSDFDALQWARTFAQAGMRGVVLTCKHHDGFCLWPTATTAHCVKASPWQGGKGDVVREVANACRALGLAFGVYLSPWDRHEPTFGTPAYNGVFQAQLRELCTGYGPLFEVWFDGAHCPADDPALFDWQAHFRRVRELQPMAVIAITGPDVRWVGNEAGRTRAQEWSVLPLDTDDAGTFEQSRAAWQALWRLRDRNQTDDLGSRARLAGARRLCWWPAETDVSIRPGWFWHAHEDAQVKPLARLLDCWYGAAGGNAVLLLNVPADRRGRIPDPDVAVLRDLGEVLRATFAQDLAADAQRKTYSKAGEVYFQEPRTVDVIELREDTAAAGQRVERFRIDTWDGQAWRELATGGTVGHRRLLRIEPVRAHGFRYWIEQARAPAKIAQFSLWRQPTLLESPQIRRDREGRVTLTAAAGDICYTTDGSLPTAASPRYREPFALPRGGTVRALALPKAGAPALALATGAAATVTFGLAPAKWTVRECSSEQAPGEAAKLAFDGDPMTWWHSRWHPDAPEPPHHLAIDLGEAVDVTGFAYEPRPGAGNGTIARWEFRVSADGKVFRTVAIGGFSDWAADPRTRIVHLPNKEPGVRVVQLVALQEIHGRPWASCAELSVLVE